MTNAKLNPGEKFVQIAVLPETETAIGILYALTSDGRILWRTDGCREWTEEPLPPTEDSK